MSNTQKNTGVSFSKFQAINWHALTMPEPIPLGPGLFMSGDNGKGKSTIMDAFIFLLLADTKNFNEASGMKTGRKRTLKSYVRGYTGLKDEEKDTDRSDYLRPGATVTHVLGELVNRRTGRPLVIGATVEMKDLNVSNEASPVWWYALDTTLADLTFFIHTENGTRVASLSEVKASVPGGKKFVSTSVRRDIRRAYSSKSLFNLCDDNMGDNAAFDRWALVIRSMMACKVEDMKDVSTFVRNYIVPNRPINTSNYDDLLSEQTALADRFERLTKQRDALHDMVTIHDEYRKTKTRQSVAGAAAKRAEELFLERAISKHSDDCEAINRSIQTLENEDTQLEARESGLKEAIMQIRSGQSDEREKTLRRSIKDTRAELQQRTDQQNTYMAGLQAMRDYDTRHASITGKHLLDRDILNELIQAGADGDPAILSKFNSILKEADRDLGFRERELGQTISSIRKTMSAMSAELNDPDRPVGDKNHKAIRTAIQTALRDKGSHGQVFFLCELLDCADESWAPAVEAYMGNYRFAIMVEASDYPAAAQAYRDYCKKHPDVYGVSLVDTSWYEGKTFTAEPNSLASLLLTDNPLALAYINDSYGCVMLTEDASAPEDKSVVSIDKGGMRYARHSYSRMRPADYLAIGINARKARYEARKKEYEQLSQEAASLTAEQKTIKSILKIYQDKLGRFILTDEELLSGISSIPELSRSIDEMKAELDAMLTNTDAVQIKALEKEVGTVKARRNSIAMELASKRRDYENTDRARVLRAEELSNVQGFLEDLRQSDVTVYEGAVEEVDSLLKNTRRGLERIRDDLKREGAECAGILEQKNRELIRRQSAYTINFESDFEKDGADSMASYAEEYKKLDTAALPAAKHKLTLVVTQMKELLQDTILNQMHASKREADRTCQSLNRILRNITYAGKRIQFAPIRPALGKKDLFDMIASDNNTETRFGQASFDSLKFDDEFEETRTAFFKRLAAAKTEEEKRVMLDYRTYCQFTVYGCDADDPQKRSKLEDLFGIGSGGEVQIPCCLILTAALLQFYNRGPSGASSGGLRVAMMDECFSKLDSNNSRNLMSFLVNTLDLQMIAAAPPGKYSDIADSIPTVWHVVQSEDRRERQCFFYSKEEYLAKLEAGEEDGDE